jgi:hypothetical protein
MRVVRSIFVGLLVLGFFVYALDCGGTLSPEEAMQCCDSMACSSQGHQGQDCCKNMPSVNATFVQPSISHKISFAKVVFDIAPASSELVRAISTTDVVATLSHAPPIFSPPAARPLRI